VSAAAKRAVIAVACGGLFGAGVCISGMTRPSKVLGFLDVGGAWDATLAVVMAVALAVSIATWRVVAAMRAKHATPACGDAWPEPPSRVIDARLIGGAALFGVGWGLAGFCPGPAIVSVVSGATATLVFVGAMAAAMVAIHVVERGSEDEPLG
jgi:hypothetical protein